MTANRIPLAGVIGAPVGHSASPRLFRHWLDRYRIAGHYIPMEITPDRLGAMLAALPDLGFVGINVTLPHKVSVLSLAHSVSDRAALIGAANTLTWKADGSLHADNTDGAGFLANLRDGAPDWQADAGPALVLGAGGAARAILSALLGAGVPEVRLSNRTRSRTDALQSEFGKRVVAVDWFQAGNAIEGAALVVNTTALGMTGKPAFRVPLDALTSDMVVADIVYSPLETDLLRRAREAGATAVDGLGMLLYQAVPGFERWFGVTPEVDEGLRKAVLAG